VTWSKPLLAVLAALPACTDHPLAPPDPVPEGQTNEYFPLGFRRPIDILFVIDDSPSMEEEQANLARNFPAFIDELRRGQGLPDVHIGVVTSDLGAGALDAGGCHPGGQGGLFRGWDQGCGLLPGHRFIAAEEGEYTRNYQGDLANVFACMARVGTAGCGYEHQLAATTRALSAPENAGFLREDALLQIVLITDEDDCSAPPSSTLFTAEFPGEAPSFRCARTGHQCQGRSPPAADFTAPLDECAPVEGGPLIDVKEFVDRIRGLKREPSQILVSGIFGWPTGAAQYRVGREPDSGTGRLGAWDYLPTCQSGNGWATAALRVKQFVEAFGENGAFESICSDDFRPVLKRMGEKLRYLWDGGLCVDVPTVDRSSTPGLQPDCLVRETLPGEAEIPVPPCDVEPEKQCWAAIENPAGWCSGAPLELVIDRKGQPAPPESSVTIKCRTCVRPDDPRCQR
jgi:hypothetical protein